MKYAAAIALGMLTALLCVLRVAHTPSLQSLDWYANKQRVTLEGVIADEPDRRPLQTKYTIAADRLVTASGVTVDVAGRVLVTDRKQWPAFAVGDRVRVIGTLERPGDIDGFRYDHYLSRFEIYSVMYRGSLSQIQQGTSRSLRRTLFGFKQQFEHQINLLYPEPHASFMAGLLTGSRRGIPDSLMQTFNTTGLTHIIAISGYNITIVIAIIGSLLFWLPRYARFFPATIGIVLFTLFVGASAAVVRAAIMGILGLLAVQFGRVAHVRLAILWTAFFMVAFNPKILWYDAGFQLSFLAVIGLTELEPLLSRFFARMPEVLAIRESLQMTVAAQIAAAPIIVLLFHRFSIIAPIANLLTAPLLPFAMLFGASATLVSFVHFATGQLLAYLGWACLEWIIITAKLCASLPLASVDLHISPGMVLAYYGILLGITIRTNATSSAPATTAQELF